MISFERLPLDTVRWAELDRFEDRTLFQTQPWLNFVAKTQNAEPVVAKIWDDKTAIGYFTGLTVRKFGVKILGSPLKGWTTAYMGFNLPAGSSRRAVLQGLPAFAFGQLGCHHVEVLDRYVRDEDCVGLPYEVQRGLTFEIDLTQSEEELFADMEHACRRSIRKSEKSGVVIEEALGVDFADDYYAQLQDVFAKQSLVPTYDLDRVRQLIRHLQPGNNLLLLRARNAAGTCIASAIFTGFNDTAYAFGTPSLREYQSLRPNEPLMWYAMRYWRNRGIKKLNLGGGGDYKRKYGGHEVQVPRLLLPRFKGLMSLRRAAQRAWKIRQTALGRFRRQPETAT